MSGAKPREVSLKTAEPQLACRYVSEKASLLWYATDILFVMHKQLTDTAKKRLIKHIMTSQPRQEGDKRVRVSKASHTHFSGNSWYDL